MKLVSTYFFLCAFMTAWLAYADYSGKVLWGAGGAARRYAGGYHHK